MSKSVQRITRPLDEGTQFVVKLPGHVAIDLIQDVIAAPSEGT